MQKMRTRIIAFSAIAAAAAFIGACGGGIGTGDSNEVAAKVNGKAIKMEEVDRGLKQQAGGEEAKFSPLELASSASGAPEPDRAGSNVPEGRKDGNCPDRG